MALLHSTKLTHYFAPSKSHLESFFDAVTDLYEEQEHTDLNLVAADGTAFRVHQVLLASCSPFVRGLLESGAETCQCEALTIHLPDFDSATVKSLLCILYTGTSSGDCPAAELKSLLKALRVDPNQVASSSGSDDQDVQSETRIFPDVDLPAIAARKSSVPRKVAQGDFLKLRQKAHLWQQSNHANGEVAPPTGDAEASPDEEYPEEESEAAADPPGAGEDGSKAADADAEGAPSAAEATNDEDEMLEVTPEVQMFFGNHFLASSSMENGDGPGAEEGGDHADKEEMEMEATSEEESASNGGGGGAIIEMGDGGDCSVLFPGDCGSDRDTNSSQDTLNASDLNVSPVEEWRRDLHVWCEPECMTYLQSKPIAMPPPPMPNMHLQQMEQPAAMRMRPKEPRIDTNKMIDVIRKIQRGSRAVNVSFNDINNHFSTMNLTQVGKTLPVLISQVQEFIFDYNLERSINSTLNSSQSSTEGAASEEHEANWNFPGLRRRRVVQQKEGGSRSRGGRQQQPGIAEIVLLQQRTVLQVVDRLKLCAHRCQYTPHQPLVEMKRILDALNKAFNKLVDMMLTKEMKILVTELEAPSSLLALRSCIHTMVLLGNEGSNHLCSLLAREGAVRGLLRHCDNGNQERAGNSNCSFSADRAEVRVLALRGLSSICCVADCIREFEHCGGLDVIEGLLCARSSSLEDCIESAGVLAQITSPWIADNHKIEDLDRHVPAMVAALTGLSRLKGHGEETFLLVSAALANLTFMSPVTSSAMRHNATVRTLVTAVRAAPTTTLFAKDQVVTVLANMAANSVCRAEIHSVDGVEFLARMLQTKAVDEGNLSPAELAAAERVQKKAAIALSRLCIDPSVCAELVRLGGLSRLLELCKEPMERNYSDAVLVACLAVLRRVRQQTQNNLNMDSDLARIFDDPELTGMGLRPLGSAVAAPSTVADSFLEYSAKQESFV